MCLPLAGACIGSTNKVFLKNIKHLLKYKNVRMNLTLTKKKTMIKKPKHLGGHKSPEVIK